MLIKVIYIFITIRILLERKTNGPNGPFVFIQINY